MSEYLIKKNPFRLGVNIDHIATLREVRKGKYPDPFLSLSILKECDVAQVTCHLREDRRHIQDHDLERIIKSKILPVNMEMGATSEMIEIARKLKPHTCTLVPEKRRELTTEGGLDLIKNFSSLKKKIPLLKEKGIRVSLFIDPDLKQVVKALELKVDGVEFHTGSYAHAFGSKKEEKEFSRLLKSSHFGSQKGLPIFAGHGLDVANLPRLVQISEIEEYNIGHSIMVRAIFVGLKEAIMEIQRCLH